MVRIARKPGTTTQRYRLVGLAKRAYWKAVRDPRRRDLYKSFVRAQLAQLDLAEDDLRQWAPPGRS